MPASDLIGSQPLCPRNRWQQRWLQKVDHWLRNSGFEESGRLALSANDPLHKQFASNLQACGTPAEHRDLADAFAYTLDYVRENYAFSLTEESSAAERPEHRLLEGVVLPKTHPFWPTHTPPLDYGCRCKLLFTNEEGLKAAGLTVTTVLPRVRPALTTSPVQEGPLATSAALDPRTALQRLLAERLAGLVEA
nr:hypothetical protein [uncultured Pseudogulbenkiania sp.]